MVGVVAVHPLETGTVEVVDMQRRTLTVESVEIRDQPQHTRMRLVWCLFPGQALGIVPLLPLTKLVPHKQQFLARMGKLPAIQRPQIGKLLPIITRHPARHRALAVDHLIMGKG